MKETFDEMEAWLKDQGLNENDLSLYWTILRECYLGNIDFEECVEHCSEIITNAKLRKEGLLNENPS